MRGSRSRGPRLNGPRVVLGVVFSHGEIDHPPNTKTPLAVFILWGGRSMLGGSDYLWTTPFSIHYMPFWA